MRTQEYNKGELQELNVKIEKEVFDSFEVMAENSDYNMAELVVIAMRRFRASHSDYMGNSSKNE